MNGTVNLIKEAEGFFCCTGLKKHYNSIAWEDVTALFQLYRKVHFGIENCLPWQKPMPFHFSQVF